MLGTLKNASVFCPLFSAFGPEPIRQRLLLGDGGCWSPPRALYQRKVAAIRDRAARLRHVLLVDDRRRARPARSTCAALLAAAAPDIRDPATDPEDMALLHFTSGTTGKPKGAVHVHEAVVAHHATGAFALDLHAGDVYWCTADPGWVTGTSYGIIAPLALGVTVVDRRGRVRRRALVRILQRPAGHRLVHRADGDADADAGRRRSSAREYDLSALRLVASVGEPLNPEAVVWGEEAFGLPIHDNWWQTETGAIMIANFAGDGHPARLDGPAAARRRGRDPALGEDGRAEVTDGAVRGGHEPDAVGELALRPGWPSMFRGYLHDDGALRGSASPAAGT